MPQPPFSLAELLSPIDRDTFLETYWEERPLVVPRERPDYYVDVLSLEDVDRMLFTQELRYPAVRLAKVGSSFSPASFTEDIPWGSSAFDGVIRVDTLLKEYRAGSTIIVDALHRSWKPLTLLCRSLEAELNHPTQVNVYLTPANAQGFGQHYDTHDAFILQISGRKHWRIYEAPLRLPLPSQPYDSSKHPTGELLSELDLSPGDLIYIPRGYVHEAMTSDTQSLHVTLGIRAYTWVDVFSEALARCREDSRFRESLPLAFGTAEGAAVALQGRFEELTRLLAGVAPLGDLLRQIDDRFVNSRSPLLEGQIAAADRADVSGQSVVRRPAYILFRIEVAEDAVILAFHGKKLRFPSFVEPALRYVADTPEFRVDSLPDQLADESKLVLVRRLIREGFLWPSSR